MIIPDSYRANVTDDPGWMANAGLEGVRNGSDGDYNGLSRAMTEG